MIAHVKGHYIEHPIIAECFLDLVMREIVFLYPAGSKGMKTDGEEETKQQVYDRFRSEEIPHGSNKNDLCRPVQGYPFVEGLDLTKAGDTKDLPDGIQQQPDDLADKIVVDELSFPFIGQIGIQLMYTLKRVVFNMITLEGDRAWKQLGKIGQDPGEAIGRAILNNR